MYKNQDYNSEQKNLRIRTFNFITKFIDRRTIALPTLIAIPSVTFLISTAGVIFIMNIIHFQRKKLADNND